MHPRRTIELRLAATMIVASVAFTAMVLVGGEGVVSESWPWWSLSPLTEWWDVYPWLQWIIVSMLAATVVGGIVRWMTGWKGVTRWMVSLLPPLVCLLAAGVYAPLGGIEGRRLDRVAHIVTEPIVELQVLVITVGVTFVLAALFIVATQRGRTLKRLRPVALVVPIILAGVLLNLVWVVLAIPWTNGWMPAQSDRPELLLPFRPCRGALLWEPGDPDQPRVRAVVRIDDVWTRFADPRMPGGERWAVSGPGQWQEGYFWLNHAEAVRLRVRSDDPALLHCDARSRPERVAPASWHRLGLD